MATHPADNRHITPSALCAPALNEKLNNNLIKLQNWVTHLREKVNHIREKYRLPFLIISTKKPEYINFNLTYIFCWYPRMLFICCDR